MEPKSPSLHENELPPNMVNYIGSTANFDDLEPQHNLKHSSPPPINQEFSPPSSNFYENVPTVGSGVHPTSYYKLTPYNKVSYVDLAHIHTTLPQETRKIEVKSYDTPTLNSDAGQTEELIDVLPFHPNKEQTVLPDLASPADEADISAWWDWPDDAGEVGANIPETTEAQEKVSKAHKLGKFIMKAASVFADASLLAPGTALHHAKQAPGTTAAKPAAASVDSDFDDWLEAASYPELEPDEPPAKEAEVKAPVETFEQWTGAFEQKGYIKEAPTFRDQVADDSRTNTFKYVNYTILGSEQRDVAEGTEITEHEGMKALVRFLEGYIEKVDVAKMSDAFVTHDIIESYKRVAQSILDSLTFIGEREYTEAAKGLGDYWKAFLDEDPARQICVLTGVSRYLGARKSDEYLRDKILETFTDEELERYSGRVVTEVKDITAEQEHLKVILLDDWTISGSQMRNAYQWIHGLAGGTYDANLEVNLLAASRRWIARGISTNVYGKAGLNIPVRAYYRAHEAKYTDYENARISGTHSSVDFDFENDINTMVRHLKNMVQQNEEGPAEVTVPPLTQIVRTYRYSKPAVIVEKARITKRRVSTDETPDQPNTAETADEARADHRVLDNDEVVTHTQEVVA